MIDPAAHSFTLGRAALLNGPSCVPFPAQFSEQPDGRIRLSGVYHPEAVANDSPELRTGRRLAFQQQWIGLNDEPDAVPLVSTRQPQLTGMYQVESATVDWVASLTINGGTVEYSAVLRRLKPASAAAIHEIQYQTAKRSEHDATVTAAGTIWLPGTRTHTDYIPAATLTRNTIDGSGVIGGLVPSGGTAGTVGTLSFGIAATDFYQAACAVEIRYAGSDSPWVAVQGAQIPNIKFNDVRITNGVVRMTWLNPTPGDSDETYVSLENVRVSGGVPSYQSFARQQIWDTITDGAGQSYIFPVAAPTIIRNTPESVGIRYAVQRGTEEYRYYTVSINRGDSFVTFTTASAILTLNIDGLDASRAQTSVTGGKKSDVVTDGYGWMAMSTQSMFGGDGATAFGIVAPPAGSEQTWAMGPYSSTVTTDADYDDLVSQWWLAAGYTQRAVSL
jgi:hypothetical protein